MAEAIEQAIEDGDPEEKAAEPEKAPAAEPPPADKPAPADPKEPQSEPGDGKDGDDPTDDELKGMRPGARSRVIKLLSQRNASRRETAEVKSGWDADKADAASYREVTQFMRQNRLEANEVQELFDIGRKLKSNDPRSYAEVLEILMPLTRGLLELTGRAVPADIRAKIDAGEMTEEAARALSQERANRLIAEQQATRVTTEQQTQQTTQATQQRQLTIAQAVDAWAASVKTTDPDFGRKQQALEDAAFGIMARRGAPQTPDQAVAFAKEAYDRVNGMIRAQRPALTPTRQTPSAAQSGNRSATKPAPSSLREAILGAMGGGS